MPRKDIESLCKLLSQRYDFPRSLYLLTKKCNLKSRKIYNESDGCCYTPFKERMDSMIEEFQFDKTFTSISINSFYFSSK